MKKTFFLENLGCVKNQVDGEKIIAQMQRAGWELQGSPASASLILVNTCGFIAPAKEEAVNVLHEFIADYPKSQVFAIGCFSQRYGNELFHSFPELSGILGNKNMDALIPEIERIALIPTAEKGEGKLSRLTIETAPSPFLYNSVSLHYQFRKERLNPNGFAYVKISEGCKRHCAFCAIPLIRGDVISTPVAEIVEEVSSLVDDGVYEINLVAQNLFDYGQGGADLSWNPDKSITLMTLLKSIFAIKKEFVIRLLYMHPDTFDLKLLDLMQSEPRLLPYLDIPFQHASQPILKSMNRAGNAESYLKLLEQIREKVPNVVIRSTFMLGFPGETKKDFETLCNFIQKANIDWAGFFVYSLEEDTASYELTTRFKHKFESKKGNKRLPLVQGIQQEISERKLQKYIGETLTCWIEERVEGEDLALGRVYFQAPEVDGLTVVNGEKVKAGDVVKCKIIRVNGVDVEAILV